MAALRYHAAGMATGFVERGGVWTIVQWVLMLAVLAISPWLAGGDFGPVAVVVGIALIVTGAVFGIAGAIALGPARTIYPEPRDGAPLVRHGIFAIVRHPLYSSLVFLSFGWALVWHSPVGVSAALVMTLFLDAKARQEERRLRRRFPDYETYAGCVKRLLPWVY